MKAPLVRVGDIAEQIRGVTFAKADSIGEPAAGYIPVLRAGNIQDVGLDYRDLVYVPASRVRDQQKVKRNDVVVAASSGSLEVVGKAARSLADFEGGFGAFLKVLRPGRDVEPSYFAHYFRTPAYRRKVSSMAEGANINNLKNEHLNGLLIPLPPLEEQRRIAAILDHADALRAKRRQALALIDELAQSVFVDMFGDPRTWASRWSVGSIDDMAESIHYGTSAKAGDSGEWPILRMGNITYEGRLNLDDLKYIDLAGPDVDKYTVRRGDMLFNRTNSADKVGKTAVVTTDRPLAIAGYLVRVRLREEHRPEFVSAYLNSPHGKRVLRGMAKAAVNQANISASEMRKISIAHPPSATQIEFASRAAAVERQRAAALAAQIANDELFASLQSRAFVGRL